MNINQDKSPKSYILKQPKKLDSNFWSRLTALEQLFHWQQLTIKHVEELLDLYSQAIEFYDSKKDLVCKYFQDKIQFILSRKEVLHKLVNKKKDPTLIDLINSKISNQENSKKKIDFCSDDIQCPQGEENESPIKQNVLNSQKSNQPRQLDGSIIPKRENIINLNPDVLMRPSVQRRKNMVDYKVNVEMEENYYNQSEIQISSIVDNYEQQAQNQDSIFEQDLQIQEEVFLQRLKKRRGKKQQKNRRFSFSCDKNDESQIDPITEILYTDQQDAGDDDNQTQEIICRISLKPQKIDLNQLQRDVNNSTMRIQQSIKKKRSSVRPSIKRCNVDPEEYNHNILDDIRLENQVLSGSSQTNIIKNCDQEALEQIGDGNLQKQQSLSLVQGQSDSHNSPPPQRIIQSIAGKPQQH